MQLSLQYQPDKDQRALADALADPIAALLPVARLHAGTGEDEATWRQLGELGILAAGVAEARGGSGLGAAEQILIAELLGRQLASPAVFATMATLDASAESDRSVGDHRIAAAFPVEDSLWIEEAGATMLLVRTPEGGALHAMPDDQRLIDDGSWGARLLGGDIGPALHILDPREARQLRLIDAAALSGIAAATLAMAVDYANMREQFGRPIGSFQAIKHHCANMAIAARSAIDLTSFAAVALDQQRPEAHHLVESAFAVAASSAIGNAGINIQVHGGIGFSAEADPHLFLKRAQLITALGGGIEAASSRVGTAGRQEMVSRHRGAEA